MYAPQFLNVPGKGWVQLRDELLARYVVMLDEGQWIFAMAYHR